MTTGATERSRARAARATAPPAAPGTTRARWSFFGDSSLPLDPVARQHERRGRRWFVVSYLFCPCHIPLTMALIGALFGGTAFGAAAAGNAFRVGAVLVAVYAVVLWRGFGQIRLAKRIEAAGGTVSCTSNGCMVSPTSGPSG